MGLYPDKKNGQLTGRWRVEVQLNGRRARGRFDTYEEAKAAEERWTALLPNGAVIREDTKGVPKRLKHLVAKTEGRLWAGKESRDIAEMRLGQMVALCGPETLLADLDTEMLDGAVKSLQARGIKDTTINKYLSSLHKLLQWGKERRWVPDLPTFPWLDEEGEGRIRWITPEEEGRLLQLLPVPFAILTRVAIATGLRRGELLSLEPQQVEKGWVHLWKTKTKVPRSVPISDRTYGDLHWLLKGGGGGMPTIATLRYHWDRARDRMHLSNDPWFTFHVTRHTCATRMVQANVNLRLIQKWLGHKRIETTIRYAQVFDEMLMAAQAHMEVFLDAGVASSPTVGYTSRILGSEGPEDNLTSLRNAKKDPLERPDIVEHPGNVRGRGEIGRHAGFRFLCQPNVVSELGKKSK